jgi:hypothetical protein
MECKHGNLSFVSPPCEQCAQEQAAVLRSTGSMPGLLDHSYIETLRKQTWLRNNPEHTVALPPHYAGDVVAVIGICPVYHESIRITRPKISMLEDERSWNFDCPRCGFEHYINFDMEAEQEDE